MCITCTDRSAPNHKFCGVARVERDKQAMRIVEYIGKGKTFPWVAETEGVAVSTAHKLFKEGLKHLGPRNVKRELEILFLQLETEYSEIRDDLESTTEPGEKAKLYAAAQGNIAQRQKLLGSADMTIFHKGRVKVSHDIDDLIMRIDEDQEIRNSARARARRKGRS